MSKFHTFIFLTIATIPLLLTSCVSPTSPSSGMLVASWYGKDFHGKKTASGEPYNMYSLTAAHKTLPFGTILEITNPANGRSVDVTINDRGPFIKGRDIDLSYAAASKIGLVKKGVSEVYAHKIGHNSKYDTYIKSASTTAHSTASRTSNPVTSSSLYPWHIQFASLTNQSNARRLMNEIKSKTAHTIQLQKVSIAGRTHYRVRTSPFPSKTAALEKAKYFRSLGYETALTK